MAHNKEASSNAQLTVAQGRVVGVVIQRWEVAPLELKVCARRRWGLSAVGVCARLLKFAAHVYFVGIVDVPHRTARTAGYLLAVVVAYSLQATMLSIGLSVHSTRHVCMCLNYRR